MTRARRIILIVLAVIIGIVVLAVAAFLLLWPDVPAGAPRIGLSMASHFVVQRPTYEAALARVGCETVLITPTDDPAKIATVLDDIDALLLTGGDDVDPALYGGDTDDAGSVNRVRDEFEIALIRAALERDMPILGVCRGIQILNVVHGGTLRNLRDDEALADRHGIGMGSFTAHEVDVVADSLLARVIGTGSPRVNSFHGQGVDVVGEDLRVCATASDGMVEAVERRDHTFVVAVQWHPEIESLADASALALFEELVRQAKRYRDRSEVTPAGAVPAARE